MNRNINIDHNYHQCINRSFMGFTSMLLLTLCIILTGCTGNEKSQYAPVPEKGWAYGDTLTLQTPLFSREDSLAAPHDISVVIRHTNSYEYSNLWLQIDYAKADTIVTDTINVILADDYGNWLGRGIGMSFQQSQKICSDADVDLTKAVKVTHIMRVDTLQGIEQVGVVFVGKEP